MTGFEVAAGALLLAGVAVAAVWKMLNKRATPEELENRRLAEINGSGKIAEGEILDVVPGVQTVSLMYSYVVAGVGYATSQGVSPLHRQLPADLMSVIGQASVKFDPRNPANSIVVCEFWSGLRSKRDNATFRDSMVS